MSNNKQSSIDKDFVPYEEALALKELECLKRLIEIQKGLESQQ